MTKLETIIKELDPDLQPLARCWLPALRRWAKKDPVAVVKWFFAYEYKRESWYRQLLRKMTVKERRVEAIRRKKVLERFKSTAWRLLHEQQWSQDIMKQLLWILISKI